MLRHAVYGAAGAVAMSAVRAIVKRLGLLRETPPEAITRQTALPPWTETAPARAAAHLAYGAAAGAAFSRFPGEVRAQAWGGPAYGVATWLFFEGVLAPLLGLRQARERRLDERAALLGDHLLYGAILARATAGRRA